MSARLLRSEARAGSRGAARRVTAALVLVAMAVFALVTVPAERAAAADGDLTSETFEGASVDDARWLAFGDACLTGAARGSTPPAGSADLGVCEKTVDSPQIGATPGALQLTDNSAGSTSNVLYDRAFPSSAGLRIVFTQYQYSTSGTGLGAADGIGFFLTDGRYTLDQPGPTGGGAGGALGYATVAGQEGVQQGYLGLGLDVYGNYSRQPYVGESCSPATNSAPNSVAVRGPGNGTEGYCVLDSTPYDNLQGTDYSDSGRVVEITVSPVTAANPYPTITVTIDGVLVGSVQMDVAAPPTFKMGFSASTGAGHEVHLVKLFSVAPLEPLGEISLTKSVDHSDATGTPQTIFTEGDVVPYSFLVTNTGSQETIENVVVTDPKIADVSCPAATLEPQDSFVCTGSYGPLTAEEAAAGQFENTAVVNGVTTVSGTSVTDDSLATIPTYITGDFSVAKTVEGTGAAAVPSGTGFAVDYTYPSAAYVPASVDAAGDPNVFPAGSGTLRVRNDGVVTSDGIPAGATVSLTEQTPPAIAGVTWGTPVFSPSEVEIGSDTVAVSLTNHAALDTGVFSVAKEITGTGATAVPEDATFAVDYEWTGGPEGAETGSGSLTVRNDGVAVTSEEIPLGATVSLTEQAPPTIDGVTWGTPVFSPSQFTIGGEPVAVTLTNPAATTPPAPTPPAPAPPAPTPPSGLASTGGAISLLLLGVATAAILAGVMLARRRARRS